MALRLFISLRCMNAQGPPFDELRDRPSTVHFAALHERSGTAFDELRDRLGELRITNNKFRIPSRSLRSLR
jgi:hypothetical protein